MSQIVEPQAQNVLSTQNVTNAPSLSDLYKISYEDVRIPSNGYVYPKESGLMNCKEIKMRYMTAADEDDLVSPTQIKKGTWLTKILANCMESKLIDADDLLLGDRNALLFWLRQTAYGANYKLMVKCRNCNCDKPGFQNEFFLDKLKLKTLDAKPIVEGKNEFEFILPLTKAKVIFSLMTNRMLNELSKNEEAKQNKGNTEEKRITSILKQQIVEINGVRDKSEIEKFIESGMTAKDSSALRAYITSITPDIILKQNATCPHSGFTEEFDIPIEAQFFLPSAESE